MSRKLLPALLILALAWAMPALAIDYWNGPPGWSRSDPAATFQHWTFTVDDPAVPPIEVNNPYGQPQIAIPLSSFEWGEWECPPDMHESGTVTGWHCTDGLGGLIEISIPNTEALDGEKLIYLQITSSKFINVSVSGFGGSPGGYTSESWPTGRPHIQWAGPAPFDGEWYTYSIGRKVTPNPQAEVIKLEVPYCTVIDQIVVDTICTGSPVSEDQRTWSGIKGLFR
jgi:hypothetical protein